MITKALSNWFLSQGVPASTEGTSCGEVLLAQSASDGQQESLEGCELGGYDGRFCLEVHPFRTWAQDMDCW